MSPHIYHHMTKADSHTTHTRLDILEKSTLWEHVTRIQLLSVHSQQNTTPPSQNAGVHAVRRENVITKLHNTQSLSTDIHKRNNVISFLVNNSEHILLVKQKVWNALHCTLAVIHSKINTWNLFKGANLVHITQIYLYTFECIILFTNELEKTIKSFSKADRRISSYMVKKRKMCTNNIIIHSVLGLV